MFPAVVVLSGPEKTRAKAELALEKARLTIIPPKEWPIQRESYAAEHWPHLTPYPMVRLPDKDEYVPAPHVDTKLEHGFVAVLAETEELFHAAYAAVEKHKWTLRTHYELPAMPPPDPMTKLMATMQEMQAEIAALKAGRS
jgi:hypothetical protein